MSPASEVGDVQGPADAPARLSTISGWEGAADVVTPWTPHALSGTSTAPPDVAQAVQTLAPGAPGASGLATLQRTAAGRSLPAVASGQSPWPATDGTDPGMDLALPPGDLTAITSAALQRQAVGAPIAPPVAPVVAQLAPEPAVQREEAPASAPAAAPASSPTATVSSESTTATSGGASPQTEEELDVLAGRLYDHIAGRLRRELRMDRERTGLLTDLS